MLHAYVVGACLLNSLVSRQKLDKRYGSPDNVTKEDLIVTPLNTARPRCARIDRIDDLPKHNFEARIQALERLYRRKEALEALIESLETYARCRGGATVTPFPLRGN